VSKGHPQVDGVSRRRLLELGFTGAAAAALGPLAVRPVAASAAASKRFASASQLLAWQRELDELGLRATASTANERYIDVLRDRLVAAGVRDVRAERVPVRRWTPSSWSLELDGAGRLPVVSYVPYSGQTGNDGVSGPLAFVPSDATPAPGSLAGAVALFELAPQEIANPAFKTIAYKVYDPRDVLSDDGKFQRWQPGRTRIVLDQLKAAGAVAAVGILNLPPDASLSGYYPYDGVLRSIPGVYVDRATGERLKAAAGDGGAARVRLAAKVEKTSSRNLLGVIPGASSELMLLNSHSDGPNAIEDNGPNAIIAMAQYLARLERRSLPRTILVSLTTGHFYGGAGQDAFIERHRGDLVKKVAAALTVEHLGALQWHVGQDRSALTGEAEPALFFAPETSALVDAAYRAAARAKADPTLVSKPITDAPGSPDKKGFPAEGNQLWVDAAIPTANFIAGPMYLFNFGRSTMDKFSAPLMRAQSLALTQMLLDLSKVSRARLRRLDLLTGA
jgi:hypothetical protein